MICQACKQVFPLHLKDITLTKEISLIASITRPNLNKER